MAARGAGQQGDSCSGVNDYLRVKFFAAIVELARPSGLDVAIVLGPDLQSSLGDQLEVGQGLPIATDLNRYYQRADGGQYGRVLRRPIFEFIKCIFYVGHDAPSHKKRTPANNGPRTNPVCYWPRVRALIASVLEFGRAASAGPHNNL